MGDVETHNPRAEERRVRQDEFEAHVEEFTRYLATVRNLSPNTVRRMTRTSEPTAHGRAERVSSPSQ